MLAYILAMIAFEVFLNGQRKFTAGGDDYQSLITSLVLIHPSHPDPKDSLLLFSTVGIVPEPPSTAFWPNLDVFPGDRIEIRIIDTEPVDAPDRVNKYDSSDIETANNSLQATPVVAPVVSPRLNSGVPEL